MRFILPVLLTALAACATTKPHTSQTPPPTANGVAESADGFYGEKFAVGTSRPLEAAKPAPAQVKATDEETVITARVSSLCPKKGCWMKVGAGAPNDLRVTFKDYDFFVPSTLVGKEVALKGRFIVYNETVAEQKHLLEDAKRPQSEIDAVKAPRQILRFEASGVKDLSVQ